MMKKKMISEPEKKPPSGRWNPDFHWMTEHARRRRLLPHGAARRELAATHGVRAVIDFRHEDRDDRSG